MIDLYPFQTTGVQFLQDTGRAILGDDPGLGKSAQAITAAEGRTLIVAPAMILDAGVWQNEVAKFRPDLDVRAVSYNGLCDVNITERGGRSPQGRPAPEFAGRWDTVIFDEAHYLKNAGTKWTKAAEKLKSDRMFFLTGTPIPNWAHELHQLLKLTHPGDTRYSSKWRWVGEWFEQNTVDYSSKTQKRPPVRVIGGLKDCSRRAGCYDRSPYDPCDHWLEFQYENLADCWLRRIRDDVLGELPPLTEETFSVPMTPSQARVYRALKKDFIAWTDAGNELVAWNQAAQCTDLAKIATGVELLDPSSPASGKLDMLSELLAGRRGNHTLVACHFRATAEECRKRAVKAGLSCEVLTGSVSSKTERKRIVREFQEGKAEVLVGSIELIKEGLTLTRADQAIFVEHSWVPSRNEQTMRRIHRIGQDRPVSVIHLVTKGTVDANMQREIKNKTDQQVRALPVKRIAQLA